MTETATHPKLHEAPAKEPSLRKRYSWGTLDLWVREPGTCISTGYMSVHRPGCWNGVDHPDGGDVYYRAVAKDGDLIVGALEAGTNLSRAILAAREFTKSLNAGDHRAIAEAKVKAKKRRVAVRPALEPGSEETPPRSS